MFVKITLDHNCILALERVISGKDVSKKDALNAGYLQDLIALQSENINAMIALHTPLKFLVSAAAIGASERLLSGGYNHHFDQYAERVASLGLGQAVRQTPVGHYGMTYYEHSQWGDLATEAFERKIHDILFPKLEFDYQTFLQKHSMSPEKAFAKWSNKRCDVLAMCSHINAGGNIFVTSDHHFHNVTAKTRLITLGAGEILDLEDTIKLVQLL